MSKRRAIQEIALGVTLILAVSSGKAINNSDPAQQPADRKVDANTAPILCVLSGKVVNFDTGEPVPYFHLLYMKSNGGLIEHLETDEQGNFHTTAPRGSKRYFSFGRSRRGTYIIDWDRQRQLASRPFRGVITDDITSLVFKVRLWPGKVLTGKVLDKSGQAVNKASVYIHCDVPAVKTDAAGIFNIQVAPMDRDFDLFAISEDMNQAGLIHLKAGATSATIRLEPTASYKGRVIGTKGRPVGPFKLLLGLRPSGSGSDCLQQQIHADTDGTFTIDDLCPKADYFAWWFPDGQINRTIGEHGGKVIDLAKYESDEPIEIIVEEYLNTLSGKVLSVKGEPISGAKIMVLTTHGIQASYRQHRAVFTGEEGEFSLANLADGEVLFNVYAKGYKSRKVWALTDAADLQTILKSPSETSICEVSVVDDENRPIPNAPVNLHFSVMEAGREVITSQTALTNAVGRAKFNVKPFGDNVQPYGILSCDIDGCDLAYNSVWHQDDSQVKLVLHEPGEHWSGKVVDPQQNPVSGARFYMTSMSQRTRTSQRTSVQWLNQSYFSAESELSLLAETNAKGEFVLSRLNKKDFVRVVVKAPGFKRQEIDFSPERDAGTVFQLSAGVAIVKGLLISELAPKPMPHANIQLRAYNLPGRDIVTDESGSFIIEDLEPGEYVPVLNANLTSRYQNYVCVPEPFVAGAGKTLEVTLKIQEGILLRGRLIDSKTQKPPAARRMYIEARLKSGVLMASDNVEEDGSWQLLLPAEQYDLYYSILIETRFRESERPLSITVERGKTYEDLVLETDDRGSLSMRPPSLVGRPLPELQGLRIRLSPADANNKMILICFWDMEQRPSRNCLRQLSKRAQELKAKDVVVVSIQASKVDENALKEWVEETNIPFPAGILQGDTESTRLTWGVKSLPWLILTDKQHIVVAEGFSVAELADKLKGGAESRKALEESEIEASRSKDSSDWKNDFDRVYRLSEREVLKRIAPPFIAERRKYLTEEMPRYYTPGRVAPLHAVIFQWDGHLTRSGWSCSAGYSLGAVLQAIIGLEYYEFELAGGLQSLLLTGDWIVRKDSTVEQRLKAFELILKNQIGKEIRFARHRVSRPLILATGSFRFHPLSGTYDDSRLHFFADALDPARPDHLREHHTLRSANAVPSEVGQLVGLQVSNQTEPSDETMVRCSFHRSAYLAGVQDWAEKNRKLNLLLANITSQMGLKFAMKGQPAELWSVTELY